MLGKHFQHSAWVESKQVTFSPVYHVAGMQLSNKYYAKHEAQEAWLAPSSKQTVNTEVHVYVVANKLLDKQICTSDHVRRRSISTFTFDIHC